MTDYQVLRNLRSGGSKIIHTNDPARVADEIRLGWKNRQFTIARIPSDDGMAGEAVAMVQKWSDVNRWTWWAEAEVAPADSAMARSVRIPAPNEEMNRIRTLEGGA